MDLTTTGCGNEVSGFGRSRYVYPTPPEYRRQVYRNSSDTGAMSGGGATDRIAGDMAVVGSRWTQPREVLREGSGVDEAGEGREGVKHRDGGSGEARGF